MRTVQVHIPRITHEAKALMEKSFPGLNAVSDIPRIETKRDAVTLAKLTVPVAGNEYMSVKYEAEETDTGWNVTVFVLAEPSILK